MPFETNQYWKHNVSTQTKAYIFKRIGVSLEARGQRQSWFQPNVTLHNLYSIAVRALADELELGQDVFWRGAERRAAHAPLVRSLQRKCGL